MKEIMEKKQPAVPGSWSMNEANADDDDDDDDFK